MKHIFAVIVFILTPFVMIWDVVGLLVGFLFVSIRKEWRSAQRLGADMCKIMGGER